MPDAEKAREEIVLAEPIEQKSLRTGCLGGATAQRFAATAQTWAEARKKRPGSSLILPSTLLLTSL